jgi:urease accessory protein
VRLEGAFADGFSRPMQGLILLLLLIGLGLWSWQVGGREAWRVPAVAVAGLLAGAVLDLFDIGLPFARWLVPGTLLAVGVLVALEAHLGGLVAILAAVVAGLVHGMTGAGPAGLSALGWLGYAAGALTLLAAGIGFAAMIANALSKDALRLAGAAIALVALLAVIDVL